MTRKKSVHIQYRCNHRRPKYIVHVSNNVTFFFFLQSVAGWIRGCGTHGYGGLYMSANITTEQIHGSQLPSQYLYKEYMKFNVCKIELFLKPVHSPDTSFSINAITMLPSSLQHLALSINFTCPYTPCSVWLGISSFLSQYYISCPLAVPPSQRQVSLHHLLPGTLQ